MEEYKEQTGWWVHCHLLRQEPKEPSDLVAHVTFRANYEIDDFYDNEKAAWAAASQMLTEQRDQALKDLKQISGFTDCPPSMVKAWTEEANASMRIALKGLELCPPE